MGASNPNGPAPGSSIKVDPIRDKEAIQRIKRSLAHQPRNLCLFTIGINTALRANEILSITVGQVSHLEPGGALSLKQSKNKKYRVVNLNKACIDAIQEWLSVYEYESENDYLFVGKQGRLRVPTVSRMVKDWCRDAELKGNYASHTMRKTWGYWQRVGRKTSVAILMTAYGHSCEQETLNYLCIQADEIKALYEMEL